MNEKVSTNIHCPLFPEDPDLWESFDDPTQREVVSLIAWLIVHYRQSNKLDKEKDCE